MLPDSGMTKDKPNRNGDQTDTGTRPMKGCIIAKGGGGREAERKGVQEETRGNYSNNAKNIASLAQSHE